jgi:hypothetical protein
MGLELGFSPQKLAKTGFQVLATLRATMETNETRPATARLEAVRLSSSMNWTTAVNEL